jgi:hypothetical protein
MAVASAAEIRKRSAVDCWFGLGGTRSTPAAIEGSVVSEILVAILTPS